MDQSITLKHLELKKPSTTQDKAAHTEILKKTAEGNSESEKRGDLYAVFELSNQSSKDIDLSKLAHDLFATLSDEYYSNRHGSPLEALEEALNKIHARNHSLTNSIVQVEAGAFSIWGQSLVFVNMQNCFMGVRRDHEFFELDNPNIGSQLIKDQDLLIISTRNFGLHTLTHQMRDQQTLGNPAFVELIKNEQPNPSSNEATFTNALFIQTYIEMVPSEEEIIEIEIPQTEHQPTRLGFMRSIKNIYKSPHKLLQKIKTSLPQKDPQEPEIYIKRNLAKTKKGKLLAVVLILLLLSTSIYFTYRSNQTTETVTEDLSILNKTQEQIERAKQLSNLNPNQAKELVDEAFNNLNAVLGSRDEITDQKNSLILEGKNIVDQIYNFKPVSVESTTLPQESLDRVFTISDKGIQTHDGTNLIGPSPEWQTAIRADSYFSNVYVIDPTANAIWKYPDLLVNQNWNTPSNYITDHSNLNNAIDLSINSSIYVLFPNRIEKFTVGEKDNFGISGTHPPFSDNSLIATSPEANYLYVTSNDSIQVFDKEGRYQHTLKPEGVSDITEIILSEDGTTLYIFSQGWLSIQL